MFVFTSLMTIGTWFIVRFFYDLVLPGHRTDPRRMRRRVATITAIGALLAGSGLGAVIGAIFGRVPGIITGTVLAIGYVLLVMLLRLLLRQWTWDEDH